MIETRDLTKMYGQLYALDRLTIKLERRDVYGFIGPNGAGKTTTMRILATLLTPTFGEATVCGYSIYNGTKDIRRVMGYMPDFFGVYDDMKVTEYLEFFAAAYRIKGADGNFLMLNGLVSKIESSNVLNIGRNAVAALKKIKALGDLSAHSRRYNAKASDIDPLRHDLRVAAEDLLHLSGQS